MLSSIQFSLIIKQIFKVEPELEPGESDGSGSSQIPWLRLQNSDNPDAEVVTRVKYICIYKICMYSTYIKEIQTWKG